MVGGKHRYPLACFLPCFLTSSFYRAEFPEQEIPHFRQDGPKKYPDVPQQQTRACLAPVAEITEPVSRSEMAQNPSVVGTKRLRCSEKAVALAAPRRTAEAGAATAAMLAAAATATRARADISSVFPGADVGVLAWLVFAGGIRRVRYKPALLICSRASSLQPRPTMNVSIFSSRDKMVSPRSVIPAPNLGWLPVPISPKYNDYHHLMHLREEPR